MPVVYDFADFLASTRKTAPERFEQYYQGALAEISRKLCEGTISHAGATRDLVDALFQFSAVDQPTVIVGLVPPYYPSVSYCDRPDYEAMITKLATRLDHCSRASFNQEYQLEAYFTGISDMSYSSLGAMGAMDLEAIIASQMPLYGKSYSIPFVDIEHSAMPCINIGPWGKDFHKMSERILKEDVFERTPTLLLHAIDFAFDPALAPRP
jgi:arginine utilization protein RocB